LASADGTAPSDVRRTERAGAKPTTVIEDNLSELSRKEDLELDDVVAAAMNAQLEGRATREDVQMVMTSETPHEALTALEIAVESTRSDVVNATQTARAMGDAAGATNDALNSAIQNGDTRGALQVILNDNGATFNPIEQLIAKRVLGMRMTLPTMRLVDSLGNDVNGEPILGQYDSINDEIRLVRGTQDSHTFLHELTHAFVHRTIIDQERSGARKPAFRDLQEAFDHVTKQRPDLAEAYGLRSLTEFASEVMSNREFQMQLMGMPYKKQSIFTWFARALRDLLGIGDNGPVGNVLFTAMVSVDGLMRTGRDLQIATTGKPFYGLGVVNVTTQAVQTVDTPLGRPLPTTLAEVNSARSQVVRTESAKFINTVSQSEMGLATLIRQQTVDILAPIAKKLSAAFSQGVQNSFGDVNPIAWMRQAFDHQRVALQMFRAGGLRMTADGFWEAYDLKDSEGNPVSAQVIVQKLDALAKSQNTTYAATKARVATVLEGMRLKELREHNAKIEALAREKSVSGDVQGAYETRLEKIFLHKTNAEIDALVNIFNNSPEIKDIQRVMNAVRGNLIDAMVESGRIRKEQAESWKAAVNYVPFDRVKDLLENPEIVFAPGRKGIAALGKIPEIKGSMERPVANTIDNFMNRLAWMTEQTMRNSAVVRTLNVMVEAGLARRLKSRGEAQNTHLVLPALYENGLPAFYEVQSPYDLAAFAAAPEITGSVVKLFSASSRLLRTTVTATPMFALNQVFADAQRVIFNSGVRNPLAALGRTLINLPRIVLLKNFGDNRKMVEILERLGIVGDYDFNPVNPIQTLEYDTKAVRRSPVRALIHAMENITKASDMAARLAVYEQTMKETGNVTLAQTRARELINFNRQGASKTMRMLTHVVPFFNSWAQGTDLMYRGFTGEDAPSGMARRAAVGMFVSRILTMSALGTMYALLMSDDEAYEEASDTVRDRNWILPKFVSDMFGMKQPFKFPVPIEFGFIFKSIPERAVQYFKEHGKDEAKPAIDVALNTLRDMSGVYLAEPIPAILRPAIENFTNFSFFTKRALVSPALQSQPAALQYTSSTSEFAKWLGDKTDVSPIRIDNFIRGYFGLMGATTSTFVDAMMSPYRPDRGLEQLPFLSIGLMAPVGSRTKDEFYEFREKVAAAVSGMNALEDNPERQGRFIEQNLPYIQAAPYVNEKLRALRDIREMRKIYELPGDIGISGEERRNAIEELRRIENEVVGDLRKIRNEFMATKK
jgi:hypothetical protein